MDVHETERVSDGEGQSSRVDASEGDQPANRPTCDDSSSPSSSEDEEGITSPPPNKRSKSYRYKQVLTCSDPRVDTLIQQVGHISQFLTNLPQLTNNIQSREEQNSQPIPSTSQFVTNPTACTLSLGTLGTEFDEKSIIPQADKERLQELAHLQKFDTPAWKGIRYKKTLQTCIATPGFVGLKLNEELCHFNKTKDYLFPTEQLLAGLSNNILEQRQLLKSGLQDLVDWASTNPSKLNANTLCEKITSTFGPGSLSHKNSETAMQIVCGKRAECIEVRRDRILKEIGNPNIRATLQNIPPSQEYLFSRNALLPTISSLGGSQVWLNTPTYVRDKKAYTTSSTQNKKHHGSYKTQNRDNKFDKKQNPKFKKNQPFRKNSTTNNTSTYSNNKQS